MTLENSPVPLYYQLEQKLRDRILSGEFERSGPLPTEDQICSEYSVSRITVRRALSGLQQQGLIERRRGVGSFVAEKRRGINSHLTGSLNEFLAVAGTLKTECLSLGSLPAPQDVREQFELGDDESAFLLRTVGRLEEGPIAYLEIWFPPDIGALVSKEAIDQSDIPVIRLIERLAKVQITRAEQTIMPGRAGEQAAHFLNVDSNAPVLRVRRAYFAGTRAIEIAHVVYHPERYSYAIEFKG